MPGDARIFVGVRSRLDRAPHDDLVVRHSDGRPVLAPPCPAYGDLHDGTRVPCDSHQGHEGPHVARITIAWETVREVVAVEPERVAGAKCEALYEDETMKSRG